MTNASITRVLVGIQRVILELIMKFRTCLWCVQMCYVAGGVCLVMLVCVGNKEMNLVWCRNWAIARVFLKDTILKQKFALYFPSSSTEYLMLKYPIHFKDTALHLHRYTFKQLSSSSCLSMKSSTTDLHPSLAICVSSNKHRWQGIF